MSWLIGRTGISLLDYWAIAHFAFWWVAGSTFAALKVKRVLAFLVCLSVAISWEIFERFAEKFWPLVWESPESWLNGWVSDPLTCMLALPLSWWGFDKWRTK